MAQPMMEHGRTHLLCFLTGVRKRLWLGVTTALVIRAVWWAAAILVTAGMIHVFLEPVSWRLSLVSASLPILLAAVFGLLFRRPSLRSAAVVADRRCASDDLLITAVELSENPRQLRPAGSPVVLRQAERTAAVGAEGRMAGLSGSIPVALLIPLGLGLAGVVLNLGPGPQRRAIAEPSPQPIGEVLQTAGIAERSAPALLALQEELSRARARLDRDAGLAQRSAAQARSADGPRDTGAALRELAAGPVPRTAVSAERPVSAGLGPKAPATGPDDLDDLTGRASDARRAAAGPGGQGPGDHDAPGSGAGSTVQPEDSVEAAQAALDFVDIERPEGGLGGAQATASLAPAWQYQPDQAFLAASSPPSEVVEMLRQSSFHPALGSYAGDYLATLRHDR